MSEGITLRWDQTLADRVDAEARMAWTRLRIRLPLLAALGALLSAIGSTVSWWAVPLGPVLIGGLLFWATRKRTLRRIYERHREALVIGPVSWIVGPGGIEADMPGRRIRVPWRAIRKVRATRDSVLLFVSRQRALFVPRRAIADVDALVEQLERWRGSPGELPSLPPPAEAEWTFDWIPTLDDHVTYVRSLGGLRPRRLGLLVLGAILFGLGLVVVPLVLLTGESAFMLGIALVYVVLGGLVFRAGMGGRPTESWSRFRVRVGRWMDPQAWNTEALSLALSPDGIYYRNVYGSGRVGWGSVTAVHDGIGCVTLMLGQLIGFSIPDHLFEGAPERARMLDQVKRWQERAPRKTSVTGERGQVGDAENPFAPPEGT